MPVRAMQLSAHHEELLEAISVATQTHGTDDLIYKSEWLGYLPYGQYHWLEVAGKEVKVDSSDTLKSDLAKLESLNVLEQISVKTEVYEKEDVHIYYRFNRHITSKLIRTKNSWFLLLRRLF